MKNVYIRELKYFSKKHILEILQNDEKILNKLLKFDFVKLTKEGYQFRYVGVIILENIVLNIYPKYISSEKNIKNDFKQIIRVIKKYNKSNETFYYQNDEFEDISYNHISMMLFFLEDYFENGVYANVQNILEINGNGEIDWNKTVNENIALIENNRPYYLELQTKYKMDDQFDYFRLLHEYIITQCSKYLEKVELLNLFDLTSVEISDKNFEYFGEVEFILNKLEKELHIEFNTHKQKLLKAMHTFLSQKNSFSTENHLTIYGTNTYHQIWEEMCKKVFNDKLNKSLKDLGFNESNTKLINIIKKPEWIYKNIKTHKADGTFIPDIVTFWQNYFVIFDAKYYKLNFDENKLSGQPGIESITKQYLYELAYKNFIKTQKFRGVKNAFLLPKYDGEIENIGIAKLEILSVLDLQDIQIIMLPANKINQYYLNNNKINIEKLNL